MLIFLVLCSGKAFAQHTLDFVIPPCPYVGIEDAGQPLAFINVFPQPAANQLTIEIGGQGLPVTNDMELSLYNMLGRLIARKPIPQGATKIQLDVLAFPSGIYLLQIRMDQKYHNRRIVVVKE